MKWWAYIFILFAFVNCREPYKAFPRTNGDGVLVVEGVLNANGKTTIKLSRTTRLSDKRIEPETEADLFIEGDGNGAVYPLQETSNGIYESDEHSLDATAKYRLKIVTNDNRDYASMFTSVLATPAIDSITWQQSASGVQLYAKGQNDNASTMYYRWESNETWEYHSEFRAMIGFKEVAPDSLGNHLTLDWLMPDQSVDNSLFTCYNNQASSTINLVSTESLSSNVLSFPVGFLDRKSIKLSVLYSILVNQYALSKEGYEFFSKMKKNTESLGSLFDAQPSELVGNIECITDPSELVVGYVEASSLAEKRIFIDNAQVPGWDYEEHCKAFYEPNAEFSAYPYPNDPNLFNSIVARSLMPTVPTKTFASSILEFQVEMEGCVDCKLKGGLPDKPAFWP